MKIRASLPAINRHAGIHACVGVYFAFWWLIHFAASMKMEACNRHFALMNGETFRAMALIDWIAAHSWLVIAYVFLAVGSIAFLQIRGRPPWTCWIIAVVYCVPCIAYLKACVYITGKFL